MNIKQTNEDQSGNWGYLPDTNTLFKYLGKKDIMELSKCSKLNRKQHEREVLKKLDQNNWDYNYRKIYYKSRESSTLKVEKMLSLLEADLGCKLRFVKKFIFYYEISNIFAKEFIRLLPNIKELNFCICRIDSKLMLGLKVILNGLTCLESVKFSSDWLIISDNVTKSLIFPKYLKRLEINSCLIYKNNYNILGLFDTIDNSYLKLYSLTIVSNRMLQNLSLGMPNLKEVEIYDYDCLDQSKIAEFLKSYPQLKKISTYAVDYNEEIVKAVLSSKCLERWSTYHGNWEGIEFNNLPSNNSIKYLEIFSDIPTSLIYKIINSCKSLQILYINYNTFIELDLLKIEERINLLKIGNCVRRIEYIIELGSSKLFNRVHINFYSTVEDLVEKYSIDKLKNYKLIPSAYKSCAIN
jgi:hypothetical protein